ERESGRKLDVPKRAKVEIDARVGIEVRLARTGAFAGRKSVYLPVASVRGSRIVRLIRSASEDGSCSSTQDKRDETTTRFNVRAFALPGWRPGRWGKIKIRATITTASAAVASGRLISSPPLAIGLSRKSPTVAP